MEFWFIRVWIFDIQARSLPLWQKGKVFGDPVSGYLFMRECTHGVNTGGSSTLYLGEVGSSSILPPSAVMIMSPIWKYAGAHTGSMQINNGYCIINLIDGALLTKPQG
ncbi:MULTISPECIES: hypothetical protein [unclassified Azospirillum]|uniref:hypothetical protein n=1 Tax=unclassified Azospirillum TaxID=2630922 RepID=UPI0011775E0B|nr:MULTISPECIES: hypothetical protein [unclassified Azospirillum]